MRYRRFIIKNYRAITGPLEIRLDRGSLMPIIGVNESGKTTILHAIFAFDFYNDDFNDGGRHLKDVTNLYKAGSPPAIIEAEIDISPSEFRKVFAACAKAANATAADKLIYDELARRKKLPSKTLIRRTVTTKQYSFPFEYIGDERIQNIVARRIVSYLPYILYFDDFRDKITEKIEIPSTKDENSNDWVEILEQLFKQTDKTYSPYGLEKLEVRERKSVLSKVQKYLNETLTKEWQTFRLDDREALKIHIEFEQEGATPARNFIKLEVIETDEEGFEHFFFISDRSKGFYWFFNFVMKLEFNPKLATDDKHSVYLLDEPGSYLHAYAQRKLCSKLRQISETNLVLYCTHSHYLLDPDIIPINCIAVADKDGNGTITLTRMIEYRGISSDSRSALQPVLDALQIKPYALDLIHTQTTVITEGIYDYFCLMLFRGKRAFSPLPSVGADSIKFYVSLMIAWQVDFRALWDNDAEGRKRFDQARDLFGQDITDRSFRLLLPPRKLIQDMFEGSDLVFLRRELGLADGCSFERTIVTFFYSSKREDLVGKLSEITKRNFEELFDSLSLAEQPS